MQRYPEIQKQAQAEIDAVVGINRLPSFSDRPDLPYLNALCKELLRHNVPLPAGMAMYHNLYSEHKLKPLSYRSAA